MSWPMSDLIRRGIQYPIQNLDLPLFRRSGLYVHTMAEVLSSKPLLCHLHNKSTYTGSPWGHCYRQSMNQTSVVSAVLEVGSWPHQEVWLDYNIINTVFLLYMQHQSTEYNGSSVLRTLSFMATLIVSPHNVVTKWDFVCYWIFIVRRPAI